MNLDLFTFKLASGSHPNPQAGTCFMEAVAWMAREKHSDAPKCACPVLGKFGIRLNDRMDNDERKMLNPLILKMMNTRSRAHEELRAAHLLRGVATRTLPVVFDLRGLPDLAVMLRAIQPNATRKEMLPTLLAVKDKAKQKFNVVADVAVAADAAAAAVAAADVAADAADAVPAYRYTSLEWKHIYQQHRSQFMAISVGILNEAIELGPHNSAEFYDMPALHQRLAEFRAVVPA